MFPWKFSRERFIWKDFRIEFEFFDFVFGESAVPLSFLRSRGGRFCVFFNVFGGNEKKVLLFFFEMV